MILAHGSSRAVGQQDGLNSSTRLEEESSNTKCYYLPRWMEIWDGLMSEHAWVTRYFWFRGVLSQSSFGSAQRASSDLWEMLGCRGHVRRGFRRNKRRRLGAHWPTICVFESPSTFRLPLVVASSTPLGVASPFLFSLRDPHVHLALGPDYIRHIWDPAYRP